MAWKQRGGTDVSREAAAAIVRRLREAGHEAFWVGGCVRDLIRAVQRIRKESGFAFTDIVSLSIAGADDLLNTFGKLIEEETRTKIGNNDGAPQEVDVEGKRVTIRIKKR